MVYSKNKNNPEELKKRLHQFEKSFSDKIYVDGVNLHELKNDILGDYTGDFEIVGIMLIGEIEQ